MIPTESSLAGVGTAVVGEHILHDMKLRDNQTWLFEATGSRSATADVYQIAVGETPKGVSKSSSGACGRGSEQSFRL